MLSPADRPRWVRHSP